MKHQCLTDFLLFHKLPPQYQIVQILQDVQRYMCALYLVPSCKIWMLPIVVPVRTNIGGADGSFRRQRNLRVKRQLQLK